MGPPRERRCNGAPPFQGVGAGNRDFRTTRAEEGPDNRRDPRRKTRRPPAGEGKAEPCSGNLERYAARRPTSLNAARLCLPTRWRWHSVTQTDMCPGLEPCRLCDILRNGEGDQAASRPGRPSWSGYFFTSTLAKMAKTNTITEKPSKSSITPHLLS